MSFKKDAYDIDLEDSECKMSDREERPLKSIIPARTWITDQSNKTRYEYSKKCISKFGYLVIKDYVMFQVSPSNTELARAHYWDAAGLERLVARWYSDQPDGIGPVYNKETSEVDSEVSCYLDSISETDILGIFKNLKCMDCVVDKYNKKAENCVVCDIILFKPTDQAFFNSCIVGETDFCSGKRYVNARSCELRYMRASSDVNTPCYVEDVLNNLKETNENLEKQIHELSKESDCHCKCHCKDETDSCEIYPNVSISGKCVD